MEQDENIEHSQALPRLQNALKQLLLGQVTYVDCDASQGDELLGLTWTTHANSPTPYILGNNENTAQLCIVPIQADEQVPFPKLDDLLVDLKRQHNLDRLSLMVIETDSTAVFYRLRSGVSDFSDLPLKSRDEKTNRVRLKQRLFLQQNASDLLSHLSPAKP